MLCGIPSDTLHSKRFEFLYVGLSSGYDLAVFGIDIAVIAKLAVSDRVAVAIVDTSVPAHTAVRVPPRIVVSCRLVDMVGHNIHDNLDAIFCRLRAEILEILFRTVA